MLLAPDRAPGPLMTIEAFCNQAGISASVAQKLRDQGYDRTNTLQYTQITDLSTLVKLLPVEIAQLRAAVADWSVPRVGL